MATEYFFVCKNCNTMIHIGRLATAEEVLPIVLAEHDGHSFKLGEDSDYLEGIEFLGYTNYTDATKFTTEYVDDAPNCELNEKYKNSKYPPMGDFISFYNEHRVG